MLPSHLDFFNTKQGTDKSEGKSADCSTAASSSTSKSVKSTNKKSESLKKAENTPAVPEPVPADMEKPNYMPFAVRKHADTVAAGSRRQSTITKKKGAEQRATNGPARTKTRLSLTKEPQNTEEAEAAKGNDNSLNESNGMATSTPLKEMKNKRKLRSSLMGSNSSNKDDEVEEEKDAPPQPPPTNEKNVKKVGRKSKAAENETVTETEKEERPEKIRKETPPVKPVGRPSLKNSKASENGKTADEPKTIDTAKPKKEPPPAPPPAMQPAPRMTRLKSMYAARVETVSPPVEKNAKKNVKSKKSFSDGFSSEDERPLAKTIDEMAAGNATGSKRNLKRQSNPKNKSIDGKDDSKVSKVEPAASEKSSDESEPIAKKRFSGRKSGGKAANSKPKAAEKPAEDLKSGNDSQDDTEKPTKVRKKRRNEFTDLSQTDQSENEVRSGRPMRKTKEAAAIYMELIGQKLNFSDFDDDNYSMDSFPELPNVKKTEQMEIEIKANYAKDKKEAKPRRKSKAKMDDKKEPEEVEEKVEPPKKVAAAPKSVSAAVVENGSAKKKQGKSFSDSDDEPLAVKAKAKAAKTKKKVAATAAKKDSKLDEKILKTESIPKNLKADTKADAPIVASPTKPAPVALSVPKVEPPKVTTVDEPPKKVKQPIVKDIELGDSKFKVPAESVAQLLSPPIHANTPAKPPTAKEARTNKNAKGGKGGTSANAKNSAQSISAILADLMPSKEESGKIFGIASVTLAQSSGPNDTKCTLGKCGSIHKPSLGPVVPTETYFTEQLSSKERRKAKVNMTHEQIEKWLTDCSTNLEQLETDSLDEDLALNKTIKPINYLQTPSPAIFRDYDYMERSDSPAYRPKGLPQDIPATVTKGPSLKAKAAPIKEIVEIDDKSISSTPIQPIEPLPSSHLFAPLQPEKPGNSSSVFKPEPIQLVTPIPAKIESIKTPKRSTPTNATGKANKAADKSLGVETKTTTTKSKAKSSSVADTIDLTKSPPPTAEKKPIYNRRTPVYSSKGQQSEKVKQSKVPNAFGAFSPDNEASVYSFDKEEDTLLASTPFRRHSLRDSNQLEECEKSKSGKSTDEKVTPTKKVKAVPEESKKSASVATSITSEHDEISKLKKLSDKIAAQIGVEPKETDADGHTFYIPLQCASGSGPSDPAAQPQFFAVKLGTEGPEGPNQKVTMRAKLVTKTKVGTNYTPMGEGLSNIEDIMKSLADNKDIVTKLIPKAGSTMQTAAGKPTLPAESARGNVAHASPSTKGKGANQRQRVEEVLKPSNITNFPRVDDPPQMVEAPIFRPTEKEFADPIDFIQRIMPLAARFGLCKIIPPNSFKPECKISDEMRFTAYNQYVHKMLHRWGPSVKELSAIKKYLATQSITLKQPPWIGGMEVDLPRLYHTVQELGGLKEVIEKKKWARVAEEMCIPKAAQDRVTKLDDIYCKYLLPYDTLSPAERQKLFDEVEADWAKAEAKARRNADRSGLSDSNTNQESDEEHDSEDEDDDDDADSGSMECIVKGKSMALSAFFRIARNTMALWFKNTEPTTVEIENEFWRHVAVRDSHVCVHSGSIDSSGWGYGFPTPGPKTKGSPCAKHPWNLKVLTNNHGSILRSIGPVAGVTVPTLHVGMLFSACCWYRDPHGLPWIEYLHTGGNKIWYGVPDEQSSNFRSAFTSLVPTHCQNKTVWLPCDTAMVPPHMLTDRGVSLCRIEQEPGQFVVVFPRAYTSSLCTSYTISESVYFATVSWLDTAKDDFKVSSSYFFTFHHSTIY